MPTVRDTILYVAQGRDWIPIARSGKSREPLKLSDGLRHPVKVTRLTLEEMKKLGAR